MAIRNQLYLLPFSASKMSASREIPGYAYWLRVVYSSFVCYVSSIDSIILLIIIIIAVAAVIIVSIINPRCSAPVKTLSLLLAD